MKKTKLFYILILGFLLTGSFIISAETLNKIKLSKPNTTNGLPLMQCLQKRHSVREFSDKQISNETLSNLLWAGFGINRNDGKRTAPSAMDCQEIDIYVVNASGIYLYNPKNLELNLIASGDFRTYTGKQDFVSKAPLNLVYVADFSKMKGDEESKKIYSAADAGFISENIYLFCASFGLGTVVRGYFDQESLSKVLKLKPNQKIILTQTIGYEK
jgi:SagB-type dehydrogenase family enzyme